jgi:SAM-dependent methyltransferase
MDDHVAANRARWDAEAHDWVDSGRESWSDRRIRWGIWEVPEDDLHLLPGVAGIDVVDLGCGSGYLSSWLARLGAHPVGLDNSAEQLATAKRFQRDFAVAFPVVHGDAERPPFRDGSFDLAVSEYGASVFCDPYRWIPEAARILRPGGHLVFLGMSYLLMLTIPNADHPATDRLQRPHFGMHRFAWSPNLRGAVEFHLPHGEMIRLLRSSGFEVEDLVEIGAPEDTGTAPRSGDRLATIEWSRRWPNEEAWIARKR